MIWTLDSVMIFLTLVLLSCSSNPSGFIAHKLQYFRIWFLYSIDTYLQYHWHRWVRLNRVIDTAESDSTGSLTPLSQTQQGHWHCRVKLLGVLYISESIICFLLIFEVSFSNLMNKFYKINDIFHDSNSFGAKIHGLKHISEDVECIVDIFGD